MSFRIEIGKPYHSDILATGTLTKLIVYDGSEIIGEGTFSPLTSENLKAILNRVYDLAYEQGYDEGYDSGLDESECNEDD